MQTEDVQTATALLTKGGFRGRARDASTSRTILRNIYENYLKNTQNNSILRIFPCFSFPIQTFWILLLVTILTTFVGGKKLSILEEPKKN